MILVILVLMAFFMWATNYSLIKEAQKWNKTKEARKSRIAKKKAMWRMSHRIGRSEDVWE